MTKLKAAAAYAALIFLSIAVPAAGTFLISLPEWTVLLPLAALMAFAISRAGTKGKKICAALAAAVFCLLPLFLTYCNPYFGAANFRGTKSTEYQRVLTARQAQSDLDSTLDWLIKRHPAFRLETPDIIAESYDTACGEISEGMTVNELNRVIAKMLAPLHDAHTNVFAKYSDDRYPKDLVQRKENGLKVAAVNGYSRAELVDMAKEISSYEVEEWISVDVGSLACLQRLGIGFPITYTLEDEQGGHTDVTYDENDFISAEEFWAQKNGGTQMEDTPFVRYEIDEEQSLAILTLDSCTYNKLYIDTVADMFCEVKEKGIKNVAVDLRNNGGGNSLVADEFIKYLPAEEFCGSSYSWRLGLFNISCGEKPTENTRYTDLTFDGGVFILTSCDSFSSAMLFAEYISDNNLGIIIGEPPANAANSYGDISILQLKNSGLCVSCSTKRFTRANRSDELLVMPDIPCSADEAKAVLLENLTK